MMQSTTTKILNKLPADLQQQFETLRFKAYGNDTSKDILGELIGLLTKEVTAQQRQTFLSKTVKDKLQKTKSKDSDFLELDVESSAITSANSFLDSIFTHWLCELPIAIRNSKNPADKALVAEMKKSIAAAKDEYAAACVARVAELNEQKDKIRALVDAIFAVKENAGHGIFGIGGGNSHAKEIIARLCDIQTRCQQVLGANVDVSQLLDQLFPKESQDENVRNFRPIFLREVFSAFEDKRLLKHFGVLEIFGKKKGNPELWTADEKQGIAQLYAFFGTWRNVAYLSVSQIPDEKEKQKVFSAMQAVEEFFANFKEKVAPARPAVTEIPAALPEPKPAASASAPQTAAVEPQQPSAQPAPIVEKSVQIQEAKIEPSAVDKALQQKIRGYVASIEAGLQATDAQVVEDGLAARGELIKLLQDKGQLDANKTIESHETNISSAVEWLINVGGYKDKEAIEKFKKELKNYILTSRDAVNHDYNKFVANFSQVHREMVRNWQTQSILLQKLYQYMQDKVDVSYDVTALKESENFLLAMYGKMLASSKTPVLCALELVHLATDTATNEALRNLLYYFFVGYEAPQQSDGQQGVVLGQVEPKTWYALLCSTDLSDVDIASMSAIINSHINVFVEILDECYPHNAADNPPDNKEFHVSLVNIRRFNNPILSAKFVELAKLTANEAQASYSSDEMTYVEAAVATGKDTPAPEKWMDFWLTVLAKETDAGRVEPFGKLCALLFAKPALAQELQNKTKEKKGVFSQAERAALAKSLVGKEDVAATLSWLLLGDGTVANLHVLYNILASNSDEKKDKDLRKYVIDRLRDVFDGAEKNPYQTAVVAIVEDCNNGDLSAWNGDVSYRQFLEGIAKGRVIESYPQQQRTVVYSAFARYLPYTPALNPALDTILPWDSFDNESRTYRKPAENAQSFFDGVLVKCSNNDFRNRFVYECSNQVQQPLCLHALHTVAAQKPVLSDDKFSAFFQRRVDIGCVLQTQVGDGTGKTNQQVVLTDKLVKGMDCTLGSSRENVKHLAEAVVKGGADSAAYKYITGNGSSQETCQNKTSKLRVLDAILSSRACYEKSIDAAIIAGLNAEENKHIGLAKRALLWIKRAVKCAPESSKHDGYQAPGLEVTDVRRSDAAVLVHGVDTTVQLHSNLGVSGVSPVMQRVVQKAVAVATEQSKERPVASTSSAKTPGIKASE